jgi:hypothetical protein
MSGIAAEPDASAAQAMRSKLTVCAPRFGSAVLLARIQASEQRTSALLLSAVVHHD